MGLLREDPFRNNDSAVTGAAVRAMADCLDEASAQAFAEVAAEITSRGMLPSGVVTQWAETARPASPRGGAAWPPSVLRPPLPDRERLVELANSSLTSPYRLWAALVDHEMTRFDFWSYASAHAAPDGRQFAESLAAEAWQRAKAARRHRRQAFHAAAGRREPLSEAAALELEAERHLTRAEGARDEASLLDAQARSQAAIRELRKVGRTPAPPQGAADRDGAGRKARPRDPNA